MAVKTLKNRTFYSNILPKDIFAKYGNWVFLPGLIR